MKSYVILFSIALLSSIHAQSWDQQKLSSLDNRAFVRESKKGRFYSIELNLEKGILYQIFEERLERVDTLYRIIGTDSSFVGTYFKVLFKKNVYSLIQPNLRKLELKINTPSLQLQTNRYLNDTYYNIKRQQITNEIIDSLPYYRNYHHPVQLHRIQLDFSLDYPNFQILVDSSLEQFKDSVLKINFLKNQRSKNLIHSKPTISFSDLKDSIHFFPSIQWDDHFRFNEITQTIVNHNIDYYFDLCEQLPEKRDELFNAGLATRTTRKRLKAYSTSSPMKKLLLKQHRKDILYATGYMSIIVAEIAGLVFLISLLFN